MGLSAYADQDQFSETVNVPDKNEPPSVDAFNTGNKGALDRTRWLKNRAIGMPVKGWRPRVQQTHKLIAAAWDPKGAQWYGVASATNDTMATSVDDGQSWNVIVPGTSGIALQSVACDNAAHIVATGNAGVVGLLAYEFDGSAWHLRNVNIPGQCTLAEVTWEPTSALWAIFAWDNASAPKSFRLFTSPDRATWTEQTSHLPTALQDNGGTLTQTQPRIGVGGGRIVVAACYANTVHLASAAASNVTAWTAASFTPTMGSPASVSDPVYIADKGRWLVAVDGLAAGGACSEIWKSDDGGVTWAQLAVLGGTTRNVLISQLAVLGLLVAAIGPTTTTGQIAYWSPDRGATWYAVGPIGSSDATARSLWAGDGNFIELDTGGATDGVQTSCGGGEPNRIAMGT